VTGSIHQGAPGSNKALGERGGRVCSLDFRPSRFFGCRVEKVLAEFFSVQDPRLGAMADAFWDLSQGTIRSGLDDRVTVEAAFDPSRGRGSATLSLFYRLPCIETGLTEKVLRILDRRTTSSGYYRFGRDGAASVRGSMRVRTSVVGHDDGESYLVTTMVLGVRALVAEEKPASESETGSEAATPDAAAGHHEPA